MGADGAVRTAETASMSHTPFIIASYAVFAAFLLWDFVAPRLALRRLRRELGARAARVERRKNA